MPLETEIQGGQVTPFGDVSPSYQPKYKPEAEPTKSLLRATFEDGNVINSYLTNEQNNNFVERGFSLQDSLQKLGKESLYNELAWVNNEGALQTALASKTRQEENKQIIDQAPWYQSMPLGVFAGVLDPTILMPGGGVVKSIRGGYSIAKSAAITGAWAGAGVGVQEALLHSTQSERTLSESGGVVLGGLIGGGMAAVLSRAERRVASDALKVVYDHYGIDKAPLPERIVPLDDAGKAAVKENFLDAGYTEREAEQFVKLTEKRTEAQRAEDLNYVLEHEDVNVALKHLDEESTIRAEYTKKLEENTGRIAELEDQRVIAKEIEDGTRPSDYKMESEFDGVRAEDGSIQYFDPLRVDAYDTDAGAVRAAGADVPTRLTREDYNIAGDKVRALSGIGKQLFPILRLSHSTFTKARELANKLTGSNLYLEGQRAGHAMAPGGSAFDQMRVEYGRLYSTALESQFDNYRAMKKAGLNVSWHEYDQAVGQALRNLDQGANEFINKGAQIWRTSALEPMLRMMQDLGALPDEVKTLGAQSYFPRSHNVAAVMQHQGEFERRLIPHAKAALEQGFEADGTKLKNRSEKLEREIQFLRMGKEERTAAIEGVEAALADLETQFPDAADAAAKLANVKEKLKDKTIPADLAKALKEDKADLEAFLKDSDYENAARKLKEDRKNLNLSAGALEEKADALIDRLEQLNEDQLRQTQRLINKGRQFEKEAQRLDPARWEKKREEILGHFKGHEAYYHNTELKLAQEEAKLDAEREKLAKKTEDVVEGAKSNFDAIKAQQAELAKFDKAIIPIKKRIEAQRARVAKAEATMARVNDRLATLDEFDPEAVMAGFRVATDELQHDIANSTMLRGMRAQRLIDKLEKLGPDTIEAEVAKRQERLSKLTNRFEQKWNPDRLDAPQFDDLAKGMVRQYFNAVTGVKFDGVEDYANYTWPVKVGNLKLRANWVPESVLTQALPGMERGFLNDEASHVMNHYLRTMAGDVALRRTFGNISLKPELAELKVEFNSMKDAVIAAKSNEEIKKIIGEDATLGIKFSKETEKTRQRSLLFLDAQHKNQADDLLAIRDRVLGRYKVEENSGNFGRFVRATNQLQHMRLMGGVVLSSLTEALMPAARMGLKPYIAHVITPMISDFEALKLGVKELKLMGLAMESTTHSRLYDFAELADPMATRTATERLIDNGTALAGKWNGLAAWTDIGQKQSGVMVQAKILEHVLSGNDNGYLRFLNISQGDQKLIKEFFQQHGEIRSGVYLANTDKWMEGLTDVALKDAERARMALWQALRKETDSMIVMSSAGDAPLFASTPLGKSILQFRSYSMSAHQKVMLRSMQEGPQRFLSGMTTLAIGGMGVAMIKAYLGGEERWKKFKESAANPGFIIGEGLDKSGVFPLLFDVGHATDSVARTMGKSFNPVKSPMLWPFPQASQAGDQTRWALGQGAFGLLGPTTNWLARDIPRAAGASVKALSGEPLSQSERRAQTDAMLYKNYAGINWLMNLYTESK